REPAPTPVYKQQARFLKNARKAALQNDAAGVRSALLGWGRLQWPDAAPGSIGTIASRVSAPLADELRTLSRRSYGPDNAAWDGSALAAALRSFAVLQEGGAADGELLPPLLPILPTTSGRS
ncbi:MAG: hypothetical protein WBN23_07760, partial [Woeseia sp.]